MQAFEKLESEVRSYIRSFPTVFDKAENAIIWDDQGRAFIDFFAGAGTLNYGHNPKAVVEAIIRYLSHGGIMHSLDKATVAKQQFIETLDRVILKPRQLEYKIQFTGPTGTNAVEAAIKLARRVTGRKNVVAFTRGYHGLTAGALALTANDYYHQSVYGGRSNVYHAPFDGYFGQDIDTAANLSTLIEDSSSGVAMPAAIILETVQGEGGIYPASKAWLQSIQALCNKHDILLIVDDIQVGNGRTGDFFSFEFAGIVPDIVCLSKSIGGGLPLALNLIKPEWDKWLPGEHTGTFRGNNLAFIAATELLNFWKTNDLVKEIDQKSHIIHNKLLEWQQRYPAFAIDIRGRGMVWGIEIPEQGIATQLSRQLFDNGLLVETCGAKSNVLKILPPLTIEIETLVRGLDKIEHVLTQTYS
ncbi:diaminobutyrate--2-oxoglutarate transaminase [Vibrio ostreicida]|uniref:Diaminobutyrate--2-oxoglutarate transaminase n=1 Tax=Vibrio ostreicida TaxID=526588 RepID=A0ABT8BTD9_9VIBR|nr:diaminobutyrate--2-oxoglutarate transaminase [Vibrio ostreicida]MDN3610395.1 diaminobutyrate--2-oxoglutarate transaminase [Vibrio ostreicida]NPD07595.1 diaminobutyrate--2-oxoglutarate transaminase [Vibrio ostreicida]